jgi:hypothetical protein
LGAMEFRTIREDEFDAFELALSNAFGDVEAAEHDVASDRLRARDRLHGPRGGRDLLRRRLVGNARPAGRLEERVRGRRRARGGDVPLERRAVADHPFLTPDTLSPMAVDRLLRSSSRRSRRSVTSGGSG